MASIIVIWRLTGTRLAGTMSERRARRGGGQLPGTPQAVFRVVGTRERIGRHHDRWREVTLIERRSAAAGTS
jgi:hypothetical protein